MTICVKCLNEKSDDDFYFNKTTKVKDKTCKGCRIEAMKLRAKAQTPEEVRAHNLKMRYGITPDDFDNMLDAQNGGCAICDRKDNLCVDHDHTSGNVRGILCIRCNTAIGYMNEMIGVTRALRYLIPHIPEENEAILKSEITTLINELHSCNC